jgi:dephospho-CoA kinase
MQKQMGRERSKIIGLTGPVGAGKDRVAKILQKQGAMVINVDEMAHTLYNAPSPLWREIVKVFGSAILMRGGKINRRKLGEIVFSSKEKLSKLNKIVHPQLIQQIKARVEQAFRPANSKLLVINAALPQLFAGVADEVWLVTASREKRLKRLLKSGRSKKRAEMMMRSQLSQEEYKKIANVIVKNDGTLKQLNAKVQALLKT